MATKRKDGANGKEGGRGGSFAGTPADRLIRLWRANDQRFGVLLDEILDSGRQPVIEAAIAKLREDESYAFIDEVDAFSETLQRTDSYGDPSTVTLFWLAVEVEGDLTEPPPVEVIERGLDSSGLLETAADTRLLPLWLDPEPLAYLEAADRRTLLHRLLESTEQAEAFVRKQDLLAPAQPDAEQPGPRFVAVVGLVEESDDAIAAANDAQPDPLKLGIGDADEPEIDPAEELRIKEAMAVFSDAVKAADPRVRRCEPIGGLTDLLDFTADEAWQGDGALDEVADFLDVASNETVDGVVDASVSDTVAGLHVRAFDSEGRLLDDRLFSLEEGQTAEAMALLKRRCRRVTTG
ncbi:hypothetical protein [Azospirillum agricola]|uniref:hypothetical protein n=1 Tax=Azospirillum agricola TaxID=1720247 RepID=UPI000A0F3BA3|nr:hypothetical protein [Azospirillum agricola]SMH31700.1 hypothetical protein SAMN02982994_0488 [Azospirillum lipoferum]